MKLCHAYKITHSLTSKVLKELQSKLLLLFSNTNVGRRTLTSFVLLLGRNQNVIHWGNDLVLTWLREKKVNPDKKHVIIIEDMLLTSVT